MTSEKEEMRKVGPYWDKSYNDNWVKIAELKKKAQIFEKRNLPVHINSFRNGFRYWFNGIISEVNKDHLVLQERKYGEVIILFNEIYDIEKLMERTDD